MDQYEEKDNDGALFINDKRPTDNHPHFRGKVVVNGVKMQISGWKKESKNGLKYISLSLREWAEPEAKSPQESDTVDVGF